MSKFFISSVVSATILVLISLLWPRLTTNPRPSVLQTVHDYALKTPIGIQTASVLGVSDESAVEPINPEQLVLDVVTETQDAVSERIDYIIMSQIAHQLQNRIDQLNPRDKEILYQTICKDASASASGEMSVPVTTSEMTQ